MVLGTKISLYSAIEVLSNVLTELLVLVINVVSGAELVRLSEEAVSRRPVLNTVMFLEPKVVEFNHEVNVGDAGVEGAVILSTLLAACCIPTQTQS